MKFRAKITNKEIEFLSPSYTRHHLSDLEGQDVNVTVEKKKNKRSINQNDYYWACLNYISEHTGHTSGELHRIFKGLFLPRTETILNGKRFNLAGSTTDLTKGQFSEYMMRISAEVAQMGITLPSPDDYKNGADVAMLLTD